MHKQFLGKFKTSLLIGFITWCATCSDAAIAMYEALVNEMGDLERTITRNQHPMNPQYCPGRCPSCKQLKPAEARLKQLRGQMARLVEAEIKEKEKAAK